MKNIHITWWSVCIALCMMLGLTTHVVHAKKRYSPAQIQQLLRKSKQAYLQKKIKKSIRIRTLRNRIRRQRKRLYKGYCENRRIVFSNPPKYDRWCFRLYKRNGKEHEAVFINGKHSAILTIGHTVYRALEKGYKAIKRDVDRHVKATIRDINKLTRTITTTASREFERKVRELKKLAKVQAKRLLGTPAWRKKILKKIAMLIKKKGSIALSQAKGKMRTKLLAVLKNNRNMKAVKSIMVVNRTAGAVAKMYAKAAAIAIVKSVALQAAKITFKCWKLSDSTKRRCLEQNTAVGMRDLIFTITSRLVAIGLDLSVIEPLSHAFAGAVSVALAAATVGIGAAAYPIVYGITSIALNLAVYAALELAGRPQYNKLYNRFFMSPTQQFSRTLIRQIPNSWMVCWGPRQICKGRYKSPTGAIRDAVAKIKRCPRGTHKDSRNNCWKCPRGYVRRSTSPYNRRACARRGWARAKYHRRGALLGARRCSRGTFFDLIRGGSCWSCPVGTGRTTAAVYSSRACEGWLYTRLHKIGVAR